MKKTIATAFAILLISAPALSNEEKSSQLLQRTWGALNEKLDRKLNEWGDIDRAEAVKHARIVPRGAQPEIIIRRSGVNKYGDPVFAGGFSFNGKFFTPGDTLRKAIEIFGPEYHKTVDGDHEWRKLGIQVNSSWPGNKAFDPMGQEEDERIDAIYIRLNIEAGFPNIPQYLFSGHLELDEVGIDAKTTIRDIRALASRDGLEGAHGYVYCIRGRAVCEVGRPPAYGGIKVRFTIDEEDGADSRIDTIGLQLST
ncbi:hypothetical protein NPS29_28595 [Pseudomonas putida]|uniref:DUF7738 domain-containing protein n=1 Tax=Pseudomonas putida TaxID=303 RepID=UPI00236469C3|nr:hypothetical protein [Pseudomonas putida]MDD1969304.1 hypothetical protein [Pseudomonas putida]